MHEKISLKSLLTLLLRECGEERILRALSDAKAEISVGPPVRRTTSAAKSKPTILELITRITTTTTQKNLLVAIGDQFQSKKFLPTANDARNFLEDHGVDAGNIRQRQDAVRPIFNVLSALNDVELEKIAKSNAYRGPSQLGPLSDAIKAAGASLRKQKEVNAPDSKQANLENQLPLEAQSNEDPSVSTPQKSKHSANS